MGSRNSSFTVLNKVFEILYAEYGRQYWWPAKTRLEVCIGAILTQNTSWRNVEKAIANLKSKNLVDCKSILNSDIYEIEEAVRPAGFYRQKAERLRLFCERADLDLLCDMSLEEARSHLLSIKGIGKETADSILLYALKKPIFVIDAYTKRIYSRLFDLDAASLNYDDLRNKFEAALGKSVSKYNEMHALLVQHAKLYCRKKPLCTRCPLSHLCMYNKSINQNI